MKNAPDTNRRGYAFLLSIMVIVVVGLMLGVFVSRQSAQSRVVGRQLEAYQLQHGLRGMQEVIRAWVSSRSSTQLDAMLNDDGYAFAVRPGDGTAIDVWFAPGQGTLMSDLSLVPESVRPVYEQTLLSLIATEGELRAQVYTRQVGPHRVDALTAPDPVLRAICEAAMPEDLGLVDEAMVRIRDIGAVERGDAPEDAIRETDLRNAVNGLSINEASKRNLLDLLTVQPKLWGMTTELRPLVGTGRGRLMGAYGSLVELTSDGSRPSFLSWDDLLNDPLNPYSGPGRWLTERRVRAGSALGSVGGGRTR